MPDPEIGTGKEVDILSTAIATGTMPSASVTDLVGEFDWALIKLLRRPGYYMGMGYFEPDPILVYQLPTYTVADIKAMGITWENLLEARRVFETTSLARWSHPWLQVFLDWLVVIISQFHAGG